MGIGVSNWLLARTVSTAGSLGVVSGTAINSVLVRRLQDGDPGGHMLRALKAFPNQDIAAKIIQSYFIEGGRPTTTPYKRSPMFNIESSLPLLQLTVVAGFVETWLAKEGHRGLVGLNLLEKIQIPNMPALYGSMLANVDCVIMGAGIPREIPGVIDLFSQNKPASIKVPVAGGDSVLTTFDPARVMEGQLTTSLKRTNFFPIVSSATLALNLKKKSTGEVNGFIVEGPKAGGHNAPPRGQVQLNELGEPIYGVKDEVNLADMVALDLPFWMAGDYATPEKMAGVIAQGAHGIQVGTLFAFTNESGIDPKLRIKALEKITSSKPPVGGWVFTDPRSSPTGFPFKAVKLPGTASETEVYEKRMRICDLGYLRHAYKKEDGTVGQRCPAEPVQDFVKKGGDIEETIGRKCLCNALMTDIGMGQTQNNGQLEPSLLTAGDDLNNVSRLLKPGTLEYSAVDVLNYLNGVEVRATANNNHANI